MSPYKVSSFTKIAVQHLRPRDLQPAGQEGPHLRLRLHLSRRSATMILGLLGSHAAGGSWPAEGCEIGRGRTHTDGWSKRLAKGPGCIVGDAGRRVVAPGRGKRASG